MPSPEIITRAAVVASGVSDRRLTDLVRTGALVRIGRGIYAATAIGVPDPRGVTAAMRAALSYESAAAWWEADLPEPVTVLHVTVPRNRGRRIDAHAGVRLHRADLPCEDVTELRGVPVTTPLRTAVDLARSRPLHHAVAILDGFLRRGLVTIEELTACLTSLLPSPGVRRARRALALVDPAAGSVLESLTRVLLAVAGLAAPLSQFVVRCGGRWLGRVDFAWPELRVILECDSFEFHGDRAGFRRDRRRYSAFTRAGWRVISVTWSDVVHEPDYVVGLVRDVLAASAA